MPCHHRGVCSPVSSANYECVCPAGYYGRNCEKSTFSKWLVDNLNLDLARKQKLALTGKLFWAIVNNIPILHDAVLRQIYQSATDVGSSYDQILHYGHNYDLLNVRPNNTYFRRGLPPVPLKCPTPLGIKGPSKLPGIDTVYARLFQREEFKPCPLRTNLMFATFAQYLALQFFKTSSPDDFSSAFDNSDVASQLYGLDESTRGALRSWIDGKLKTRIINGEEYPPYQEDAPNVPMYYPNFNGEKSAFPKWAMSNRMFSITPFMFTVATIWLREHNRVCDILLKEHPEWNDEKIYQTARKIVLGELLTITTGEYFQHMAQYHLKMAYKPHLIHDKPISTSNQMEYEFNLSFHWHQMMPDVLSVQGTRYNLSDLIYSNNRIVFEHGLDGIVDFMCRTSAGEITHRNCGKTFGNVMKKLIDEGRRSRLYSFNEYRRFFGLQPYLTFRELTGEEEISAVLEQLYKDVDAVEFIVGSFLEKHPGTVVPPTMILLSGPVALRCILNHPIGSSALWRSSTFGGKTGFDIVQKASLKKLFCLNLKQNCKNNVWVSFKTPSRVMPLE